MIRLTMLSMAVVLTACYQPTDSESADKRATTEIIDDFFRTIVSETGLAVVDISVPFERFVEAPTQLRRISSAVNNRSVGIYVMRYRDDTTRRTYHVFAVTQSGSTYIKLTELPTQHPIREEFQISSAAYDEQTKALVLRNDSADIRLTPAHVTPAGA
jgi:hypothetical protein